MARGERTVKDLLREEYFALLPDIRRVVGELEAEVKHCLLPISRQLDKYEQLVVTARVKDCESAIDKLRRRLIAARVGRGSPTGASYAHSVGCRAALTRSNSLSIAGSNSASLLS